MSEVDESKSDNAEVKSPWTPKVRRLLEDWRERADDASKTHYAQASRLSALNLFLGIPVVVLTTFVGTSVFATLQEPVNTGMRIFVGVVSVAAAVLASLQTFLSFAEKAEKHRQAAERWAAMRREITEILALHPSYLATRGDPKNYLDDLRKRMDEVAAESRKCPVAVGSARWNRRRRRINLWGVRRAAEHRLWRELAKLTCASVTDEECINTAACQVGLRPGSWYRVVI